MLSWLESAGLCVCKHFDQFFCATAVTLVIVNDDCSYLCSGPGLGQMKCIDGQFAVNLSGMNNTVIRGWHSNPLIEGAKL